MPIVECDGVDCLSIIEGLTEREFLYNLISQMKRDGREACLQTAYDSCAANYVPAMGEGPIVFIKSGISASGWAIHHIIETGKTVILCPSCVDVALR